MNPDEIVFDEIKYREPVKLRRPDRDRKVACLAYEVPGPDELPIFLDRATADAIERHALRDTSVELGGILLGKECVDDQTGLPFVWVTKSLEAKHYENTQASFTYTHDSWEEISRERDQKHPDLDIVGWYHTHPDFGIFLSSHDLFIQHHFFAQPLQVAYVVDPIRQTRGFFQWREGAMVQVGGFYLSADRGDRVALSRLVNDLENIPNPDGGGGGLSPRLEAELIAMLSRPTAAYAHAPAVDRTSTNLLFALLGGMFGVLAFSAVLWLSTMNNHVEEQARVLHQLQGTIETNADRQRVLFDAALADNPELDSKALVNGYARSARTLEDLRAKLDNQGQINNTLAADNRKLLADVNKLELDLSRLKSFENEVKELKDLRTEVAKLRQTNSDQADKLKEVAVLFEDPENRKLVDLTTRADRTWYYAAAGWTVSLMLALCLVGGYAYLHAPIDEPRSSPTIDPGTHRIT